MSTPTSVNISWRQERSFFRQDIHGLRGIAVLLVVVYHAGGPVPGGFFGVDVFFVLSGFVITGLLLRNQQEKGKIDLPVFFARRFLRLAPALGVVVGFWTLATFFLFDPGGSVQRAALTGVGALTATSNVIVGAFSGGYFDDSTQTNLLMHTWSLSVEEQFYFFFALALALVTLLAGGRERGWIALIASVTAASLCLTVLTGLDLIPPFFGSWFLLDFYSPLLRAWEFGAGALAYFMWRAANSKLSDTHRLWTSTAGLLAILISALVLDSAAASPSTYVLIPVAGTIGILIASPTGGGPAEDILKTRLLRFFGSISYSFYLWHWPMVVAATRVWPNNELVPGIAVVLSIIPSYLSYRFVENPLRSAKLEGFWELRRPFISFVLIPAVISVVVWAVAAELSRELKLDNRADWATSISGCASFPEGKTLNRDGLEEWAESCRWNEELSGAPVYLIGDSVASMYSDPLIEAAQKQNRPFVGVVHRGCRPFQMMEQTAECEKYVTFVLDWIARQPTGTVVVAFTDTQVSDDDRIRRKNSPVYAVTPDEKAELFASLLRETLLELDGAGHKTAVVNPIPHFRYATEQWNPRLCSVFDYASHRCSSTVPRSVFEETQGEFHNLLSTTAISAGARVIDLSDRYCSLADCSTTRDGELVYVDPTHLTVMEARQLSPIFGDLLASMP